MRPGHRPGRRPDNESRPRFVEFVALMATLLSPVALPHFDRGVSSLRNRAALL